MCLLHCLKFLTCTASLSYLFLTVSRLHFSCTYLALSLYYLVSTSFSHCVTWLACRTLYYLHQINCRPIADSVTLFCTIVPYNYVTVQLHTNGCVSQKTPGVEPMLVKCWATVCDAGPALNQHWLIVPYLLGIPLSQFLYTCVHTIYKDHKRHEKTNSDIIAYR